MKIKKKRVFAVLLAALMLAQSVAVPQKAAAKEVELELEQGYVYCWRKGLPPQDGQWYRTLIAHDKGDARAVLGNSHRSGPEEDKNFLGIVVGTIDDDSNNYYDMSWDENKLSGYGFIDLSKDSFFSDNYFHTPMLRFDSAAGTKGYEPLWQNAPYYTIRLSDWSGEDGRAAEYLAARQLGESTFHVPSFPSTEAALKSSAAGAWAFVDKGGGKYQILFPDHHEETWRERAGIYQREYDYYLKRSTYHTNTVAGDEMGDHLEIYHGDMGSNFSVYYAERFFIDVVKNDQVIKNGEIVNISGDNYSRLQKGSTLTVEDGGILSIGSGIYNDGKIVVKKGGTLIVKSGAFLTPWAAGRDAGSVILEGGDMIVGSNGRVYLEGADRLTMKGGTLYNFGAVFLRFYWPTLSDKPTIHNKGTIRWSGSIPEGKLQTFRDADITGSARSGDWRPEGLNIFDNPSAGSMNTYLYQQCADYTGNPLQ